MSDDVNSRSFAFNELGCCEIIDCSNPATETIDVVIPWKSSELGKWYLCRKCTKSIAGETSAQLLIGDDLLGV
jgi:hypothetical protein